MYFIGLDKIKCCSAKYKQKVHKTVTLMCMLIALGTKENIWNLLHLALETRYLWPEKIRLKEKIGWGSLKLILPSLRSGDKRQKTRRTAAHWWYRFIVRYLKSQALLKITLMTSSGLFSDFKMPPPELQETLCSCLHRSRITHDE